jgi:threonylcarbamoyladenosine tRNA methylthiotransferase MtaB
MTAPAPDKGPHLITLGCRLNMYESDVMRQYALDHNLDNTVIINTCAVTNEAERQSRQAVRRARRDFPDAKVIVTGCSVQQNPDTYARMPEVDHVLGNHEKVQPHTFADLTHSPKVQVADIMTVTETAHHLVAGVRSRLRSFIEIQNGCNHRCTFCSIPLGRGNNRSVPVAQLVRVVKELMDQGTQEIVLTGVDITGYGSDLPGNPSLSSLIQRLLTHVPTLKRLRLSSLDPAEIDAPLMELIVSNPVLMPHIHLSLQAGHDMILKRMKRRHLQEDVRRVIQTMHSHRPDIALGADVIAGFPTETDAYFEESLAFIQEMGFVYLHVFPYSPRKGTPAARMPQVEGAVIKERAARLRSLGETLKRTYFQSLVGTTRHVLLEGPLHGYTDTFAPLTLVGNPQTNRGDDLRVHIAKATPQGVQGEVIS